MRTNTARLCSLVLMRCIMFALGMDWEMWAAQFVIFGLQIVILSRYVKKEKKEEKKKS